MLVSIVGTQITDPFTDVLGVPLAATTAVFAVVFTVWWRQERTLAITAIDSPARERFSWGAVLTTFALGTAGGDFATEALSLGFRSGVLIFGAGGGGRCPGPDGGHLGTGGVHAAGRWRRRPRDRDRRDLPVK